jgi:hypothetical protein
MPQPSPPNPVLTVAVCALAPLYFGATDTGFWPLLFTGGLICMVVSKIEGNTRRDPHDPGLLITFAGTWMWTTALGLLLPYGLLLVIALGVIAFQIFGKTER